MSKIEDYLEYAYEIILNRKKHSAILIKNNNNYKIKIFFENSKDGFNISTEKNINICGLIKGINEKITFIDCSFVNFQGNEVTLYVDRILIGKHLKNCSKKQINEFSFCLDNINPFFGSRVYKDNVVESNIEYNPINYIFNLKQEVVGFNLTCKVHHNNEFIKVSAINDICVKKTKKINFDNMINDIYSLKNLFMIIFRKNIFVDNIKIIENGEIYQLFNCSNDNYKYNEGFIELLDHHILNIKNINNFENIINKYNDNAHKLEPILNLYYNNISFNIPNEIRLINALNMIEYLVKQYYESKVILITKSKKPKKNQMEYVDMVYFLVKKVNCVYNFTEQEMKDLSEKIKKIRTYYFHLVKDNTKGIKLNYGEQFEISNFIEEIILFNILIIIGIDKTILNQMTLEDVTYSMNIIKK